MVDYVAQNTSEELSTRVLGLAFTCGTASINFDQVE